MSAVAVFPMAANASPPFRRVAASIIVATLPLTYALTIPVGFPLKIYEVVLGGLLILAMTEGRLLLAPGLRRFIAPLGVFLAFVTVVLVYRLAVRLDTFTVSGFESRAGPVGDGVLKLGYWGLAVFAFLIVATATYENASRIANVWCTSALCAALYGWALTITSALRLPSPLLPGMDGPARITLGGREVLRGGTFQEGNFFSLYLLTSLAIALWLGRKRAAWFLGATVFITFSTANVAGLVVILGVLALHRFRDSKDVRVKLRVLTTIFLTAITLLGGLVATGYLSTIFIAKLSGAQFISGLDRLDLTVAGVRMAAAHPIIGVGVSQYGFNYRPYQLTDVFDISRPVKPIATNSWVELAAETGALGTGLVLIFGMLVWQATRGADRRTLRAGLIAIGLGLFSFPAPTVTFLWGYCGFVVGVYLREERALFGVTRSG
jgi:O-Antigen ligase